MSDTQGPKPTAADLTEQRFKRCQPIVQEILQKLVDEKFLLADLDYVKQAVSEQFETMAKHIFYLHAEEVFNMVFQSLNHHYKNFKKEKLGKDPDEVTVADIHETLLQKEEREKKALQNAQEKEAS